MTDLVRRYLRVGGAPSPGVGGRWVEDRDGAWILLDAAPWGLPGGPAATGPSVAAGSLPVLAPWGGTKVVGIGSNYRDHAAEMGKPIPVVPKLFLKAPSAVIGPSEAIEIPPDTQRVDHEAELGVVIGRRCQRVAVEDAMDFVFGYTAVNDVTARDFQREDGVFARAKGFDTFCPVGPALVTGLDPRALGIRCRVNGVARQDGNTANMVFGVAELVSFVSRVMTLEPGDLIATGTPAGVGPLVAGDTVEVEIEGLGVLRSPVRDRADRA